MSKLRLINNATTKKSSNITIATKIDAVRRGDEYLNFLKKMKERTPKMIGAPIA
jgi:hypothetical protein